MRSIGKFEAWSPLHTMYMMRSYSDGTRMHMGMDRNNGGWEILFEGDVVVTLLRMTKVLNGVDFSHTDRFGDTLDISANPDTINISVRLRNAHHRERQMPIDEYKSLIQNAYDIILHGHHYDECYRVPWSPQDRKI